MQCSRLLYPFAWLPRRAKHHGQKVTRLSDFENGFTKNAKLVDTLFTDKYWVRPALSLTSAQIVDMYATGMCSALFAFPTSTSRKQRTIPMCPQNAVSYNKFVSD